MAADTDTSASVGAQYHSDLYSAQSTQSGASDAPVSPKRTISGNFFSRLGFLRATDQDEHDDIDVSAQHGDDTLSRQNTILRRPSTTDPSRSQTIKQRKRKGSLRKSALLGGRRYGADGRERKNSLLQRSPTQELGDSAGLEDRPNAQFETKHIYGASTASHTPHSSSSDVSYVQDSSAEADYMTGPLSHKLTITDTSTTTDDDDLVSAARLVKTSSYQSLYTSAEAMAAQASYFPPQLPSRTRSKRRQPSPLQHSYAPAPEPYSYAETEYWGWVILFGTWLLFTVGMGSCLDIWSWAWDVGESPYAPPELEDDPTLPIVGYYPALIVLSGVVAWVWITVAWVGMKYFRHAKIEV